jgi:hypothetical protein
MRLLKFVGWYEIAAGVFGIATTAWATSHQASIPPFGSAWIACAFFAVLIVGGARLSRGDVRGVRALLAMNGAQVLFFSIGGVVWRFTDGLQLSIAVDNQSPQVFAGLAATFLVGVRASAEPFLIGVNIVPALIIVILLVLVRRIQRDRKIQGSAKAAPVERR